MAFSLRLTTYALLVVLGCQEAAPDRSAGPLAPPDSQQAGPSAPEDPGATGIENHQEHKEPNADDLKPYELIKPRLTEEIHWTPGATVTLGVELVVTDTAGETRVLDYNQVGDAHPVVEINFLDGDLNYHSLAHVKLSERPGKGVYSARFDLPRGARGADLTVHLDLEKEGLTVDPLEIKGIPIEYDLFFGPPSGE